MALRKRMKSYIHATVATLGILLVAGPVQSVAADSPTSYIGSNLGSYYSNLPSPDVLWSNTMDTPPPYYRMGDGVITVGDGKVYAIQKGQLLAINVQSGTIMWKYGSKLTAPLLYQDGIVYISSEAGTLYAVNAASGKNKWTSSVNSKDAKLLVVNKDQLFVSNGDIGAYNLKNGQFQWRDQLSEKLFDQIKVEDDLILAQNEVSGAYSYNVLHAFDRYSGKQLWDSSRHDLPIASQAGTLLSQREPTLLDHLPVTTLDTLDAKTGKVIKTVEYNPTNLDTAAVKESLNSGGKAWIGGDRIYIHGNRSVYSYPLNVDPAKATKEYYSIAENMDYAAGPYDGRVLFSNGTAIYGVKTANKSLVTYSGLNNSIARFDLLGHGMYVAQSDGSLTAINLITAAPVLNINLTSRSFGPTILENGIIIVQGERNLVAFKEPTALRMN